MLLPRPGLVWFAGVLLVLSIGAETTYAGWSFTPQNDAEASRDFDTTTVRVFPSKTGATQIGSGVVIDGEGLILSAAHILQGHELHGFVWVAFPGDTKRHRAKILTGDNVPVGNDLSIFRLDPPLAGVSALDVQFAKIDTEQEHRVTGYGRSNPNPVPGKGTPSKTDECTYTLRTTTLYGDSGSPVVTPQGLVGGIAIDGAESLGTGTMSEMRVLPLLCVIDQILMFVSGDQTDRIMDVVLHGTERELVSAFRPRRAWASNLRLAKALVSWIAARQATRQPSVIDQSHLDTAIEIILERQLGPQIARNLVSADRNSARDAGDVLQKFGDDAGGKGLNANAAQAYSAATALYLKHVADLVPQGSEPAVPSLPADNPEIARAYIAAAETMRKLAGITGDKDDLNQATSLAAAAVLTAPSGRLRGFSWATLGEASHEAGDIAVAVPAYRAAIEQGATKIWIKKGLRDARSTLGTAPQTDLSASYLKDRAYSIDFR